MSGHALEVESVVKRYAKGATPAVDGLSFAVARGEVFGLLGPNGAGKTTTLSMLAGLFPPDSGSVRVAGRDLARDGRETKGRLGFVPQEIALYPTLTAAENLAFFGRLYGLSGAALEKRVARALARVELTERGDRRVDTFSGGMRRRVNIAAALLHDPEVLLLDEPTVGVDPQSRAFILEGIVNLADEGLAVVYSTHYMEEAERICSRVAIVDRGRLLAVDAPEALVAAHGGPPVVKVVNPSLETVFLSLTGESLRD